MEFEGGVMTHESGAASVLAVAAHDQATETSEVSAVSPPAETNIDKIVDPDELDRRIEASLQSIAESYSAPCFPMMVAFEDIDSDTVDQVYGKLRNQHTIGGDCLYVLLDSGGGDIHAAYNIALLLRRYAVKNLTFVVPRWAKSAATLLACSGDRVLMTPVAELGPVDPQITAFNPLERRLEYFSPLNIESTLDLIRTEFATGNQNLAEGLMGRLQFPLTLGSFKASLEVGKEYLQRLLSSRMLKGKEDEDIRKIADRFVEGYSDHGFVIEASELQGLGLVVDELDGEALDLVWTLHLLVRRKEELRREHQRQEMQERIRQLPSDLLEFTPGNDNEAVTRNGERP